MANNSESVKRAKEARRRMAQNDTTHSSAAAGFGLSRSQTVIKDVKDSTRISGRTPIVPEVIQRGEKPTSSKQTSNPFVARALGVKQEEEVIKRKTQPVDVNKTPGQEMASNALRNKNNQFIYNSDTNKTLSPNGFDSALSGQQGFRQEIAGMDRQINFYNQRNTLQGDDVLHARMNSNRNAINALGGMVDDKGFAIRRDQAGNQLSPNDPGYAFGKQDVQTRTRLDFGGEANNPFVGGINDEGVTYARGSRMDKQINRDALITEVKKRNPNINDQDAADLAEIQGYRNDDSMGGEALANRRQKQYNTKKGIETETKKAEAAEYKAQNPQTTKDGKPFGDAINNMLKNPNAGQMMEDPETGETKVASEYDGRKLGIANRFGSAFGTMFSDIAKTTEGQMRRDGLMAEALEMDPSGGILDRMRVALEAGPDAMRKFTEEYGIQF